MTVADDLAQMRALTLSPGHVCTLCAFLSQLPEPVRASAVAAIADLGFPWYGFGKRLLGWYSAVGAYDYAASGHWHVPIRWAVNTITHWGSGSPESANTYAQEYLASGSQEPSQWLIFQGANGPTAEYSVRLG